MFESCFNNKNREGVRIQDKTLLTIYTIYLNNDFFNLTTVNFLLQFGNAWSL